MSSNQTQAPRAHLQQRPRWQMPASLAGERPGIGPSVIAWAYLRHELLYICWALMDVALIAPVALILMPWIRFWPLPAFMAWLLFVMLIPFNLSRLMSLAGATSHRQRRTILVLFVLVFFVALRTLRYDPQSLLDLSWLGAFVDGIVHFSPSLWRRDLILFVLTALLWQRGTSMMNRHVAVNEVGFRLRLGSLLLAPLLVALSLVPAVKGTLSFVMLFFLAALVAVALSRAEEVATQETGAGYPMSPRWAFTVFLTSLFIVSTAALLGLALSGQGLRQALHWLSPMWDALLLGGMVVVTTATYLLLFLLAPLQWLLRQLISMLGGLGVQNLPDPDELAPQLTDQNIDQLLLEFSDSQGALLLWLNRAGVVLFVLFVLFVLYVAFRRYNFQREVTFDREGVGQSQTSTATMEQGLGHRIVERLRRLRRWRAAATVRQLYRSMCEEAAERGYPRALSETPFEYLATLAEAWPTAVEDVRLITDAYVRVRYGEVPESDEELESIRSAWQRVQRLAQE